MPDKKLRYDCTDENIGVDRASDAPKATAGIPSNDVSPPTNSVLTELAEKIRNKYFPTKEPPVKRGVRVVKRAEREADSGKTAGEACVDDSSADNGEMLDDRTADWVHLYAPKNEFEQLIAKIGKTVDESALAQERITKDQEEIEQLKMETRAMLAQLCAA